MKSPTVHFSAFEIVVAHPPTGSKRGGINIMFLWFVDTGLLTQAEEESGRNLSMLDIKYAGKYGVK